MNPITDCAVNNLAYRGIDVERVIKQPKGIADLVHLMLCGNIPPGFDGKHVIIPSLIAAWLDHGSLPPSTQNVRNCASVGVPFVGGVIAGLSTWGELHAPVDHAAAFLSKLVSREGDPESIDRLINQVKIIPGLGHPLHTSDPRITPLLEMAKGSDCLGKHFEALKYVHHFMHTRREKKLTINLAGLTAAIWLDLGYSVQTASLIPIIGRSIGWAAHFDEQTKEPKFRGTPPK